MATLSKKSWHSWLFRSTYGVPLPQNLCTYFWGVVLAVILAVPFAITHIVHIFTKKRHFTHLWFSIIPYWVFNLSMNWRYVFVLLGIVVLSGLGFALSLLMPSLKSENDNLFIERFKAFKGKYCPKINWREEPNSS